MLIYCNSTETVRMAVYKALQCRVPVEHVGGLIQYIVKILTGKDMDHTLQHKLNIIYIYIDSNGTVLNSSSLTKLCFFFFLFMMHDVNSARPTY
jgi:hypothetical protein